MEGATRTRTGFTLKGVNMLLLAVFALMLSIFTLVLNLHVDLFFTSSVSKAHDCKKASQRSPQTHAVTFHKHEEFWDLTAAGDEAWSTILPSNGGFLPNADDDGNLFLTGVGVFHQLHCLRIIRQAFQHLGNNDTEEAASPSPHASGSRLHFLHCFDYLIQAITCSGDDTIEEFHLPSSGVLGVTGWGVERQCRDITEFWARAERLPSIEGVLEQVEG